MGVLPRGSTPSERRCSLHARMHAVIAPRHRGIHPAVHALLELGHLDFVVRRTFPAPALAEFEYAVATPVSISKTITHLKNTSHENREATELDKARKLTA